MNRDNFIHSLIEQREIKHFHLFCGLGGGAKGFNEGEARVGNLQAKFRCLGGIDVDPGAIRDFDKLAGVPGTVLDLFSRDQYESFHGHRPPKGWRESARADIHRAAGNESPDIVFLSAPCKGFSGLLSEGKSQTDRYQALNSLTLGGVWKTLDAFADDPAGLYVFENVPRIANRGRFLLDRIVQLFTQYGYAVSETTHDCGELGGLAQSRKRFLLVARHTEKVPPFLYEPPKRPLAAVGSVLGRMPLPGDAAGGPMHRIPSLQWKTWVRLAFVEAGSDWRSLSKLAVEDGYLRDYLIVPEYREGSGFLGVRGWEESTGTIQGRSLPTNGAFSVADPRAPAGTLEYSQYGVMKMEDTAGAVINVKSPGQGTFSVADPRPALKPNAHQNIYRIIGFDEACKTVSGASHVAGGALSVADPRGAEDPALLHGKYKVENWNEAARTVIAGNANGAFAVADPRTHWPDSTHQSKLSVLPWEKPSKTVTGSDRVGSGALCVCDPRPGLDRIKGDHYLTGGHYGVARWEDASGAVSASACHDNGPWSIADPRIELPPADRKLIARIISLDGTWHRPFTTLELAALQGLVDPEEQLELDGLSDSAWRERIGNAVPPPAAKAIASEMGRTLLLAWSGETFALGCTPIWVRPVAVALSVAQGGVV